MTQCQYAKKLLAKLKGNKVLLDQIASKLAVAEVEDWRKIYNEQLFITSHDQLDKLEEIVLINNRQIFVRRLLRIDEEMRNGQTIAQHDLQFLYAIDASLGGFGYEDDPLLKPLLKDRDPKQDAPIVFDCRPDQIAWSQAEITDQTKVYIGPLFTGIFEKNFKYIYTRFPDQEIKQFTCDIDSSTAWQLLQRLDNPNAMLYPEADLMMRTREFRVEGNPGQIKLVALRVRDLGFKNSTNFNQGASFDQISERAMGLGLQWCAAEIGPRLLLKFLNRPQQIDLAIAMLPILQFASSNIFVVKRLPHKRLIRLQTARVDIESTIHFAPNKVFVFQSPA